MKLDAKVENVIASNGWLASRLLVVDTPEQALQLYESAERIPQSETRAFVERQSDIKINGPIPIAGAQTAIFLYAFEKGVPKVLKIPSHAEKASSECKLYLDLVERGLVKDFRLVPVKPLKLSGDYTSHRSPMKKLSHGILMPAYVCTFQEIPKPIDYDHALRTAKQFGEIIKCINTSGWVHGDLKPSNIFVDATGELWLGDYGSSMELSSISMFTGGTPLFQIEELQCMDHPYLFDIAGLLLSLLDRLDLIRLVQYNKLATVQEAVSRIPDSEAVSKELKSLLSEWMVEIDTALRPEKL